MAVCVFGFCIDWIKCVHNGDFYKNRTIQRLRKEDRPPADYSLYRHFNNRCRF